MANVKKKYKHAVIATDVVIFTIRDDTLQVLLLQMKKHPFAGTWAMPGGLIEPDESLHRAAKRILWEKAALKDVYLEQLAAFGEVGRDPFGRVVSIAYLGLVTCDNFDPKTTPEYDDVRWFPVERAPRFAYDHEEMLAQAVTHLQERLPISDIASGLMPESFTLSELQSVHEIVLGKKLDKRNFRKQILSQSFVCSTGQQTRGAPNRPAELYKFIPKKNSDNDAR